MEDVIEGKDYRYGKTVELLESTAYNADVFHGSCRACRMMWCQWLNAQVWRMHTGSKDVGCNLSADMGIFLNHATYSAGRMVSSIKCIS